MNRSQKWATGTLTAALWVAWIVAYATSRVSEVGVVHHVVTEVLRLAVILSSVIFALAWMIAPAIATARVWREIGAREREHQCESCPVAAKRAAKLQNLIPTNFNGSITRIGDVVRIRDN